MSNLACAKCERPPRKGGRYCQHCHSQYMKAWRQKQNYKLISAGRLVHFLREWRASYSEDIFPEINVDAMTRAQQQIITGASGRMGRAVLDLLIKKLESGEWRNDQ